MTHSRSTSLHPRAYFAGCGMLLYLTTHIFLHPLQISAQVATSTPSSQLAEDLTLSAIPPRLGDDLSLRARPGQTIQTAIKVRNSSSVVQTIETLVENFIVDAGGTQPIPVTQNTPNQWSLASWVTLSPERQTLQPNETALINVVIEVPEDALSGGRYAMLMHQPIQTTQLLGSASGVAQRVGTLLYFIVEGGIQEEAYITQLTTPTVIENGPIPISFFVDNRSDTHIKPSIVVQVQDMFGTVMDEIPLESKNIFPYTTREFDAVWNRYWGLGKYTVTITASYGSQGKVATARSSVWLVPIKALTAIAVILAAQCAVIIVLRHHRHHTKDAQAKKIAILEKKIASLEHHPSQPYSDADQV